MMTFRDLLFRTLLYYRRTNLAVLLGVAAATAVITGALIVGDSVRDSLMAMSQQRLGRIDDAVLGQRFFREALAAEFQQTLSAATPAGEAEGAQPLVAPVLIFPGTVQHTDAGGETTRAGQVNIYGTDQRLWALTDHGDLAPPGAGEAVMNSRLAEQLGAKTGDSLSLVIEIPSLIPRDALLGERNETVAEVPLKISGIVPETQGLARLGMNPTQQLPANLWVSLPELQTAMGLQKVERSRRQPQAHPARVNALFIADSQRAAAADASELTTLLQKQFTLEDLGLRLVENSERGYLSLESEQMFLDPALAQAAEEAATTLGVVTSPVLVYLANELSVVRTPEHYSMYSVIAGVDPVEASPFGPFTFTGEHRPLGANDVYLNTWIAEDLQATVGDELKVRYHQVGDRGELPEEEHTFQLAGIVKLEGAAADRGYTPDVPGVTDAESYAEWREPFPLKRDRITDRDDDYWSEYRTTPKAFVSLATAQKLWRSRYGSLTTLRLAPATGQSLAELRGQFEKELLARIDLAALSMNVQPVRATGLQAAQGTTDFTGLFIGFSFFLIFSAAMLVGLLFRLSVEQRWQQMGLLSALGLTPRRIRWLLLCEGGLLVVVGGVVGLVAAIGYAALMIHGLKTWWYAAIGTRFLFLSVHPASLMSGWIIAAAMAGGAIWWGQRQSTRQSVRALLNGILPETAQSGPGWWSWGLAWGGLGGSGLLLLLMLIGAIPDVEAFGGFSIRVVLFFLVGMGLLTGSLAAFSRGLRARNSLLLSGRGTAGEWKLGFKNAARNRSRSVLTASLIASATFVIVAVAAGQMNPIGDAPRKQSGNGGFTLVAQSSVPILYDLNTNAGRVKLGFDPNNSQQETLLAGTRVFPFRMKPGENASCLNLYQTQLPTILGVPEEVLREFAAEDRFQFADTPAPHPWELLNEQLPQGQIPVLGDMNTLMYSLHKGLGAEIPVPSEADPRFQLQVVGMFANSIFQGVLVMSEQNFQRLFPEVVGFRYFLLETDLAQADAVARLFESQLGDSGFDADLVSRRLADFLSVQNTYLSTFQTLGGLGLLLGTLGLATVMLRNVLERRKEFALLQAVGFPASQVGRLVLWENGLLLGGGLLCGTASALLAMSPHLMTSVANVPWPGLLGTLLGIFALGMLAALAAVRAAVQTPLLATLRGD